jgi:hypothetical protein
MNKDLGLDAVFQPREGGRRLLAINLATVVCPTSLASLHGLRCRIERGSDRFGGGLLERSTPEPQPQR